MDEKMYKELCLSSLSQSEKDTEDYMFKEEGISLAMKKEITWGDCWYTYFNLGMDANRCDEPQIVEVENDLDFDVTFEKGGR